MILLGSGKNYVARFRFSFRDGIRSIAVGVTLIGVGAIDQTCPSGCQSSRTFSSA